MKLSTLALSLTLLLLPIGAMADDIKLPDNLKDADPQTLMAVGFGLMKLSDGEKEKFGDIIGEFTKDVRSAVSAEMRRNLPNAPRRINRRMSNLFDDLDKRVKPIVNKDRMQGYLLFKKGLAEQMRPRRL